jgi:hypothetical protein
MFRHAARWFGEQGIGMPVTSMDVESGPLVVTSVLRALRLLELFEPGRPEMSLADIVRARVGLGRTPATVMGQLWHSLWLTPTD